MSTETVVNRAALTPGLERDLAELDPVENKKPEPIVVEDLSFSKDLVIPDTRYSQEAELVSRALKAYAAPRDPDLALFRKQVLDAFRHFGLDTKKFFN